MVEWVGVILPVFLAIILVVPMVHSGPSLGGACSLALCVFLAYVMSPVDFADRSRDLPGVITEADGSLTFPWIHPKVAEIFE